MVQCKQEEAEMLPICGAQMKFVDRLQTMTLTYQEICQGEQPWIALGNFMNDWFDYAKERRVELITTPLLIPEQPTENLLRWAIFCAASVEYLCGRYDIPCPSWVHDPQYGALAEPWFDAPMAHKPSVRAFLLEQTPEPFARRNIYCGNRVFANKYEFAEQYHQLTTTVTLPPSSSLA
jgi:hypothetical protein